MWEEGWDRRTTGVTRDVSVYWVCVFHCALNNTMHEFCLSTSELGKDIPWLDVGMDVDVGQ